MSKKSWIINVTTNSLIVVLTIVAILLMFFGDPSVLASTRWEAFKYFTVQSNVFAAITALISLIYLFKKNKSYPVWLITTKLVSSVGVGVTFTVVIVYLVQIYPIELLYNNANLFLHGIIPVLAIASFVLLEPKAKINFKVNFFSLLPVGIYGTFYLINVAANNDFGNYNGADWYAFGKFGVWIGLLSLSIILIMSFAISVGVYLLHQKTRIKCFFE